MDLRYQGWNQSRSYMVDRAGSVVTSQHERNKCLVLGLYPMGKRADLGKNARIEEASAYCEDATAISDMYAS